MWGSKKYMKLAICCSFVIVYEMNDYFACSCVGL